MSLSLILLLFSLSLTKCTVLQFLLLLFPHHLCVCVCVPVWWREMGNLNFPPQHFPSSTGHYRCSNVCWLTFSCSGWRRVVGLFWGLDIYERLRAFVDMRVRVFVQYGCVSSCLCDQKQKCW